MIDRTSFIEEIVVDGKQVIELLSGDPWTNTEVAYELLKLSNYFIRGSLNNLNFYSSVERILKRRYQAYITGIAPGDQEDGDIEGISVLDALIFFREIGVEAENITNAIECIWESVTAKQKLDAKSFDGFWMLREEAEKNNPVAKVAMELLREAYRERVE